MAASSRCRVGLLLLLIFPSMLGRQVRWRSVADFMKKVWLTSHFFLDVVKHWTAVFMHKNFYILDHIVNFPDADLYLRACIGHLPWVWIGSTDLLHCDLGPEGAAAMGGLVAMAHGAIGLLCLLETDALQLLAPVMHCWWHVLLTPNLAWCWLVGARCSNQAERIRPGFLYPLPNFCYGDQYWFLR